MESLRETVEQLTGLLSQYGVPVLSQTPSDSGGETGRITAEPLVKAATTKAHPTRPQKQKGSPVVVSVADDDDREIAMTVDSTGTHASAENVGIRTNEPLRLGTSKKIAGVHWNSPLLRDSNLVAVAMEFVLTYVCLPRTKWQGVRRMRLLYSSTRLKG